MLNHPLLNLASFTHAHPPQDLGEGTWREKARHELHRQPGVRMHITVEQAADLGYGLWRDEELADAGLDAAEYDSIAFAQQLTAVLIPQLSLQNLQHLVAALTQALAAEEGDRAVRLACGNPAAPDRPDAQPAGRCVAGAPAGAGGAGHGVSR